MQKTKISLYLFLFIGILFPLIFTMTELGVFSSEPKVEITNTVTSEDAGVLRVVADFDFSPYSFYNKNNEITGLDVELINEIANRLGMKAEIIFTDWPNCKKLLQSKEADLILGLEIFSHMNGVLKTVPASEDTLSIFGKTAINNIAELKGKNVGLMVNSVITRTFDLNCHFVEFYTNTDILKAIDAGYIDYGICHNSVGMKIIEKNGFRLVSSAVLMNSYPAIGVREDLPELRDSINDIINQMSTSGLINKLDEKWLINYTKKHTLKEVLNLQSKFYIIYTIFFLITLFMMLFILIHLYHQEEDYKKSLEYQKSLKKQNDMLTSLANIYNTMHVINIKTDELKIISSSKSIEKYVNHTNNASEQMKNAISNLVIPEDKEIALSFTELSSLAERMKNKKILQAEFRSQEIGWFNMQFIAVSYDAKGSVEEVMFTTQTIDEIKKEKERLLQLSSYDELTKLYNRHTYEENLRSLTSKSLEYASFMILDINELKTTNDNLGHMAGDELIIGASECIRNAFNNIGNFYRIGGDEFAVLITDENVNIPEVVKAFDAEISNWKGIQVKSLAVSKGYALSSEIPDFTSEKFSELIKLADKRMYEDKANYYKEKGINRRR